MAFCRAAVESNIAQLMRIGLQQQPMARAAPAETMAAAELRFGVQGLVVQVAKLYYRHGFRILMYHNGKKAIGDWLCIIIIVYYIGCIEYIYIYTLN